MNMNSVLCGIILLSACFATANAIADEQKLQQQIESLIQRVDGLEQRLSSLEGETELAIEQSKAKAPPLNPGVASDLDNWSRLHGGLNYDEVRALLGEPVSISRGASELWYYSEQGRKGPHLKFLFSKLHFWKPPSE